MNRIAAPILVALALSIASAAHAAPLSTPSDVAKFFQQQKLNGN